MEELLNQLETLGFPSDYLNAVKDQNFSEVSVPDVDNVEYSTYDNQIKYNTKLLYSERSKK